MSTPYLGEIRAVGFTFPPEGWATCNGQTLSINENQALFALIGTTYGGNGQTTFNVPNLSSRVALGSQGGSTGNGLSNYPLGTTGGTEGVTLTTTQMPMHAHSYSASLGGNTGGALSDDPAGNRPGAPGTPTYASAPVTGLTLAASAVTGVTTTSTGGNQSHPNIQPVLALNYIICTEGIFPPQPQ